HRRRPVAVDQQADLVLGREVDRAEQTDDLLLAQSVLGRPQKRLRRLGVLGAFKEPKKPGTGQPPPGKLLVDHRGDAADDATVSVDDKALKPAPPKGGVVLGRPAAILDGPQRGDPQRVPSVETIGQLAELAVQRPGRHRGNAQAYGWHGEAISSR